MNGGRIIVIGASWGGVRALRSLAGQFEPGLQAPVLVVQHVGSHPSILPDLLGRAGPLPAAHAVDGQQVEPGKLHVAPPDHHMLLDGDTIRLSRGARENHARPAIDPLFRSAAATWGEATIGVVLTGSLDDGTAGLQAIKEQGGIAVVQDPDDAEEPSMPRSALRHVKVDHRVPLASMAPLLARLAASPVQARRGRVPDHVLHEHEIALGKGDFMKHLEDVGKPSTFTCPDCAGSLWEVTGSSPRRFRCHTGHGFTLRSLQHAHANTTDDALWGALRALQEKEILLNALAEGAGADYLEAQRLKEEAEQTGRHARDLRGLIERLPSPPE